MMIESYLKSLLDYIMFYEQTASMVNQAGWGTKDFVPSLIYKQTLSMVYQFINLNKKHKTDQ